MIERTHKALADEIIAGLPQQIDLIYVSQGDSLTDEQVAAVVAGDTEKLWDLLSEWESDSKYEAAVNDIKEAAKETVRGWEREDGDEADYSDLQDTFDSSSEDWERVYETMQERESGDWFKSLMNGCSEVLLRILVLNEDHAYYHEEVAPERVLADVGMPDTEENRKTVQYALDNASPEYSALMGFWIVGADVSEIFSLDTNGDAEVEITDPHLYLGNPLAGDGFITEQPIRGTVRVNREALRTDKDAFGYPVAEVYGGLDASEFSATIRAVPQKEASDA